MGLAQENEHGTGKLNVRATNVTGWMTSSKSTALAIRLVCCGEKGELIRYPSTDPKTLARFSYELAKTETVAPKPIPSPPPPLRGRIPITFKEKKMKIDSGVIFKKAVAREEALRDFIDALDSVDNIQVKLTELLCSFQMLLSLYRGLDDENRSLLPEAVYEQCKALSIHTERIQACLTGCGGLSIEKLLLAIKES